MREIKFKAWSKIGAKMSPPVTMKQWCYAQYDTTLDPLDDSLVIFLQFTGLKDKNGKAIYEGDIGKDEEDGLYEVRFDDGCFETIYDGNIVEELSETHDALEVIGNVYENSELLK